MNFKKDVTQIMSSLNWATAEEDYTPSEHWYNGTEKELVDAEGSSSRTTSRTLVRQSKLRSSKSEAQQAEGRD